MRREGVPLLVITGPGEFAPDAHTPAEQKDDSLSLLDPANIVRAYTHMGNQAVYLSRAAAAWLGKQGAALPPQFVPVQKSPRGRIVEFGEYKAGIMFFPLPEAAKGRAPDNQGSMDLQASLPAHKGSTDGEGAQSGVVTTWREGDPELAPDWDEAFQKARLAGESMAPRVHLLIGVSPWGLEAEKRFLAQAEGLFHIILGAGSGYAFPYSADGKAGGVLWARPDTEGKSVNLITLRQWPEPAAHLWQRQANFEARLQPLGQELKEDEFINTLLGTLSR